MNSTTKRISVLAAGGAVFLVMVWFLVVFRPQTSHLKAAHSARAAAEAKVSSLQSQVSQLDALLEQVPTDQKSLKTLEAAIPTNPDLADALAQLHQVATQTGVDLSSVGPSTPTGPTASSSSGASSTTPTITLTMSASGSYQQLVAFLTALDHMPRTVTVTRLGLTSGATGAMTASFTAEIFYAESGNTDSASPNS